MKRPISILVIMLVMINCSQKQGRSLAKPSILVISEYGLINKARPALIFSLDSVSKIEASRYYVFSYNIIVDDSVLKELSNRALMLTRDTGVIFKSGFSHGFKIRWYNDDDELVGDSIKIRDSVAGRFLSDIVPLLGPDSVSITKVQEVSWGLK